MAMPGKEAIPNACPNQSSSPVPYLPIQCICRPRAITPRCLIQIYTNVMMGRFKPDVLEFEPLCRSRL